MRLTRQWREKTKLRPKVRPLTKAEQTEILRTLEAAVAASPLLSGLGIRVCLSDSRFCIERKRPGKGTEVWGRLTPLVSAEGAESAEGSFLLETERANGQWFKIATGEAATLVQVIASDTRGTFHGLGAVEASFRRLPAGQERLPVIGDGCDRFVYADTGQQCSVQETLFHCFGVPVEAIANACGNHRKSHCYRDTGVGRVAILRWWLWSPWPWPWLGQ